MTTATQHLRKLRGGSQCHLLRCDDGKCYATKMLGNPQGDRILVNEWVAAKILDRLGIPVPRVAVITVTAEFLAANPEIAFGYGHGRVEIRPGEHFGSEWIVKDPDQQGTYDFIPDTLLATVANLRDFLGMLCADKWLGNVDGRQVAFARVDGQFWGWFIDHGYIFDGPHWDFQDAPLCGLYHRPMVYGQARSWADFELWLGRIEHFRPAELRRIAASVPAAWLPYQDRELLDGLIEGLVGRRKMVRGLVLAAIEYGRTSFVNWNPE